MLKSVCRWRQFNEYFPIFKKYYFVKKIIKDTVWFYFPDTSAILCPPKSALACDKEMCMDAHTRIPYPSFRVQDEDASCTNVQSHRQRSRSVTLAVSVHFFFFFFFQTVINSLIVTCIMSLFSCSFCFLDLFLEHNLSICYTCSNWL